MRKGDGVGRGGWGSGEVGASTIDWRNKLGQFQAGKRELPGGRPRGDPEMVRVSR